MGRVRRFLALAGADRRRIVALLWPLSLARLGLWLLPFPVMARWAARPVQGAATLPADEWARLVRQAAVAVPGATCLTQALVLQRVLHRHGQECTVRLGVRRGEDGIAAHAWVEYSGAVVLGGPDVSGYTVLSS